MTIKSSLKDLIKKMREANLYLLELILLHSVMLFCRWLHLYLMFTVGQPQHRWQTDHII